MIDLKPACQGMIDVLALVTDDQLDAPTPCTEYAVTDLIEHIGQVSQGFASVALGALGDNGDATSPAAPAQPLDAAERAKVAEQVRQLGEAWQHPAAWQGNTDAGGLELSNELWGKIALTEMVVHGWDLARATGRTLDVPEQTLRACLDHVSEFVPQAPVPELWAPAVPTSADAPLLDRVVAITGRTP